MPKRPPPIELDDMLVLTQYGARPPAFTGQAQPHFRTAPRAGERDVSVLAGHLTRRQAALAVRQEFVAWRDIVRYTTVERLRNAGFRVRSTPSRMIPNHVSVEYDGDWTDDVAKRFDDCFGQPTGGGGGHG
jgi:hypothetical protein